MEIRRCCPFFLFQIVLLVEGAGSLHVNLLLTSFDFSHSKQLLCWECLKTKILKHQVQNIVTLLEISKCTCALGFTFWLFHDHLGTRMSSGRFHRVVQENQWILTTTAVFNLHGGKVVIPRSELLWEAFMSTIITCRWEKGGGFRFGFGGCFLGLFVGGQVGVGETLNFFVWWCFVYRAELLVESTQCRKCERMYHAACIYIIKKRNTYQYYVYIYICLHVHMGFLEIEIFLEI